MRPKKKSSHTQNYYYHYYTHHPPPPNHDGFHELTALNFFFWYLLCTAALCILHHITSHPGRGAFLILGRGGQGEQAAVGEDKIKDVIGHSLHCLFCWFANNTRCPVGSFDFFFSFLISLSCPNLTGRVHIAFVGAGCIFAFYICLTSGENPFPVFNLSSSSVKNYLAALQRGATSHGERSQPTST